MYGVSGRADFVVYQVDVVQYYVEISGGREGGGDDCID